MGERIEDTQETTIDRIWRNELQLKRREEERKEQARLDAEEEARRAYAAKVDGEVKEVLEGVRVKEDSIVIGDDEEEVKPYHDENGRFLPGNDSAAIPVKKYTVALKKTIRKKFPPDKVVEILERTLKVAEERGHTQSMLTAVQLILAYSAGKPTQLVEVQNDTLQLLGEILRDSRPLLPPRDRERQPIRLIEENDESVAISSRDPEQDEEDEHIDDTDE